MLKVYCCKYEMDTVRYKILEGENFGEMAYCNIWWIIFWRIAKFSQKSKTSKKNEFSPFTEQKPTKNVSS